MQKLSLLVKLRGNKMNIINEVAEELEEYENASPPMQRYNFAKYLVKLCITEFVVILNDILEEEYLYKQVLDEDTAKIIIGEVKEVIEEDI